MSRHLMLTLRVVATVGFPALQFKAVKKQFVATRKVPKAVVASPDWPPRLRSLTLDPESKLNHPFLPVKMKHDWQN